MEDLKLHDYDEYTNNGELLVTNNAHPTDTQENNTVAIVEDELIHSDGSNSSASGNWDFYNNSQNVTPYHSNGGSNYTQPTSKSYQKKRRKNKTQRNSRRINRKK